MGIERLLSIKDWATGATGAVVGLMFMLIHAPWLLDSESIWFHQWRSTFGPVMVEVKDLYRQTPYSFLSR